MEGRAKSWPFTDAATQAEYEALRAKGYALLRQAHAMLMAALGARR